MKMMLLCAASMVAVSPALAQNTYPTQAAGVRAGGQVMMLCDAGGVNCRPVTSASPMPIDSGSGATSSQTQGTAPNGSAPVGNPNLIAGSDGTNVRTIRTGTTGAILLGMGGATSAGNVVATDATTGNNLLGAGILGQYQTTPTTYANGQFGTLQMSSKDILFAGAPSAGGVVLTDGGSNTINAAADGNGLVIRNITRPEMFDPGAGSWLRLRGDTTGGLYTQERERSQFFQDFAAPLAAGGSISNISRDGGASPSQWGTFSCFARSDQASAASGFAMQASNDGTTWVQVLTGNVGANTPTRITDRNDFRYHRCLFINGATATTGNVTVTSSFGN